MRTSSVKPASHPSSFLHSPFHGQCTVWLSLYFQWTLPRALGEHGAPNQPGDTQLSQATDTRKLTPLEYVPPHCPLADLRNLCELEGSPPITHHSPPWCEACLVWDFQKQGNGGTLCFPQLGHCRICQRGLHLHMAPCCQTITLVRTPASWVLKPLAINARDIFLSLYGYWAARMPLPSGHAPRTQAGEATVQGRGLELEEWTAKPGVQT